MDETRRIGRSLLVLLAALLLVYVIFFDVHWDVRTLSDSAVTQTEDWSAFASTKTIPVSDDVYYNPIISAKTDLNKWVTNSVVQNKVKNTVNQLIDPDPNLVVSDVNNNNQQANSDSMVSWSLSKPAVQKLPEVIEDLQGRTFFSTNYLFWREWTSSTVHNDSGALPSSAPTLTNTIATTNVTTNASKVLIDPAATWVQQPVNTAVVTKSAWEIALSNTWKREGTLDIIDKLNLEDDVQYVLKDIHNSHFIHLGKFSESVSEISVFLWWTSVDIVDQIAIQNSQLIGKKVTKIVIPSYKRNLKELMIITFENWDSWFLQIDKDYYSVLQNKVYVKNLFEEWY